MPTSMKPLRTRGQNLERAMVYAVADRLFQTSGEIPSIRAIEAELDSGGKDKILKFRKDWYQERTGQSVYAVQSVQQSVQKIFEELNAAITAKDRMQQAKITLLAEDVECLAEECEQLRTERNVALDELDHAEKGASQCNTNLDNCRQANQALIDLFASRVLEQAVSQVALAGLQHVPELDRSIQAIMSEFRYLALRVDIVTQLMEAGLNMVFNNEPIELRLDRLRRATEAAKAAVAPSSGSLQNK